MVSQLVYSAEVLRQQVALPVVQARQEVLEVRQVLEPEDEAAVKRELNQMTVAEHAHLVSDWD